jgi:hypothetical protein
MRPFTTFGVEVPANKHWCLANNVSQLLVKVLLITFRGLVSRCVDLDEGQFRSFAIKTDCHDPNTDRMIAEQFSSCMFVRLLWSVPTPPAFALTLTAGRVVRSAVALPGLLIASLTGPVYPDRASQLHWQGSPLCSDRL